MEYTIICNRKTYSLPAKTISVMEKMEDVSKVDELTGLNIREKFEKCHTFLKEVLGEEKTEEILGSSDLEKMDLSDITLTINKIVDAYNKPIQDYQDEKMRKAFNGIPMEKIISMTKAAQSMANVQMKK